MEFAEILVGQFGHCLARVQKDDKIPSITFRAPFEFRGVTLRMQIPDIIGKMSADAPTHIDLNIRRSQVYRFVLPSARELNAALEIVRRNHLIMFQNPSWMNEIELRLRSNGELNGTTAEEFFAGCHIGANAMLISLATRFGLPPLKEFGLLDGYRLEAEHLGAALPRNVWPRLLGAWLDRIFATAAQALTLGQLITPAEGPRTGSGTERPEVSTSTGPYADPQRLIFYMRQPGYIGLRANETATARRGRVTDEYLIFLFEKRWDRKNMLVIQDNPWVGHAAFAFDGPLDMIIKLLRSHDEATDETRRSDLRQSPHFRRAMIHFNACVGAGDWMSRFAAVIQELRSSS